MRADCGLKILGRFTVQVWGGREHTWDCGGERGALRLGDPVEEAREESVQIGEKCSDR